MRGQLSQSSLPGNNFSSHNFIGEVKTHLPSAVQTFTASARTNGPESGSINPPEAGAFSLER